MSDNLLDDLLNLHEETYKPEKADRVTIIRAPFRMAGSKYYSLQHLIPRLPVRRKWVDHFLGTGIVTLNRPSCELEVMNDRYGGVVAFYRCMRDAKQFKQMYDYLCMMPPSREEFYTVRDHWIHETDDVVRAAKWFYCMNQSVMGKMVAWGRSTDGPPSTVMSYNTVLPLFQRFHARIKNVQLENLDFETCAYDYDGPGTVHYFDPPYISTGAGVYEHAWTRDDLRRLLRTIRNMKGFCALSGYADPEIDAFDGWTKRHTWEVSIGAEMKAFSENNNKEHYVNVQQVDKAQEVLWIKEAQAA